MLPILESASEGQSLIICIISHRQSCTIFRCCQYISAECSWQIISNACNRYNHILTICTCYNHLSGFRSEVASPSIAHFACHTPCTSNWICSWRFRLTAFILHELSCNIVGHILPVAILPLSQCESTVSLKCKLNHCRRIPDCSELRMVHSTDSNFKLRILKRSVSCEWRTVSCCEELHLKLTEWSLLAGRNLHTIDSWLLIWMCPSLIVNAYECLLSFCKYCWSESEDSHIVWVCRISKAKVWNLELSKIWCYSNSSCILAIIAVKLTSLIICIKSCTADCHLICTLWKVICELNLKGTWIWRTILRISLKVLTDKLRLIWLLSHCECCNSLTSNLNSYGSLICLAACILSYSRKNHSLSCNSLSLNICKPCSINLKLIINWSYNWNLNISTLRRN